MIEPNTVSRSGTLSRMVSVVMTGRFGVQACFFEVPIGSWNEMGTVLASAKYGAAAFAEVRG